LIGLWFDVDIASVLSPLHHHRPAALAFQGSIVDFGVDAAHDSVLTHADTHLPTDHERDAPELFGKGRGVKVDVKRTDLAIPHFEHLGDVAAEGRAPGRLEPVAGQGARIVSSTSRSLTSSEVIIEYKRFVDSRYAGLPLTRLKGLVKLVTIMSSDRNDSHSFFCLRLLK
jgi:hypothetical protein